MKMTQTGGKVSENEFFLQAYFHFTVVGIGSLFRILEPLEEKPAKGFLQVFKMSGACSRPLVLKFDLCQEIFSEMKILALRY